MPVHVFDVIVALPGGKAGWRHYWDALRANCCCDVELGAGMPGTLIVGFRLEAETEPEAVIHAVSDVLKAISQIRTSRGPRYMDFRIDVRTAAHGWFRGEFELTTWRSHGRKRQ